MSEFMSHRNSQSREAGRFVTESRSKLDVRRQGEKRIERLVLAMVLALSGMATWTAVDTLPHMMVAGAPQTVISA